MANLKGGLGPNGSYDKQVKDGFMRLIAFKVGRVGNKDHLTHSDGLAKKREMYLRDYQKFAEQNGFTDKLNLTMTSENVSRFLDERLVGLKASSAEDYLRGFSSLQQGLVEKNINVPCNNSSLFDDKVKAIKATTTPDTRTNLAVNNATQKIEQVYQHRFESGVISEVLKDLGVRISEGYEIIKNLDAYYNPSNGTIENLKGKGNHTYEPKNIDTVLIEKIRACENISSANTYRNDLKEVGVENPHLWRYTYAKSAFESKIENGVEYHRALREVSQELNHSRESISLFYLNKT